MSQHVSSDEIIASMPPDRNLLNLGCGDEYQEGWHNVDISREVDADQYFDAGADNWPLPDQHFSYILAKHIFEHLDAEATIHAFRECGRVLKPGGTLEVRVPFGADQRTDPTHETTWDWLTPERFTTGGEYGWETGALPFELVDKDANVWCQPPPGLLERLWYVGRLEYYLRRHGPGRWITGYPFVTGEIIATYRRVDS